MLTSVKAFYEDGKITLMEEPPVTEKTEVTVLFPTEAAQQIGERKLGTLKGKFKVPDDFNEPLEELKDYM